MSTSSSRRTEGTDGSSGARRLDVGSHRYLRPGGGRLRLRPRDAAGNPRTGRRRHPVVPQPALASRALLHGAADHLHRSGVADRSRRRSLPVLAAHGPAHVADDGRATAAAPRHRRERGRRRASATPRVRTIWWAITRPWPAVIIFNVVLLLWHIPSLYDTTLTTVPGAHRRAPQLHRRRAHRLVAGRRSRSATIRPSR